MGELKDGICEDGATLSSGALFSSSLPLFQHFFSEMEMFAE